MAEEPIVVCPNCGKRLRYPPGLAGKNARCPCGQSIPIPANSSTVMPALGYRSMAPVPAAAGNDEHSAVVWQAIGLSALLLVLIGAIWGVRHLSSAPAVAPPPALGDDAMIQKMIDTQNGTEARKWMDDLPGRMLSGMTISQAKRQIDAWYNMGARTVYAFGGEMSLSVAIELPVDPGKRAKLFDWVNNWNGPAVVPPAKDVGQRYLLVRLRI